MTSSFRTAALVSTIVLALGCGGSSPAPADASIETTTPGPPRDTPAEASETPAPMQVAGRFSRPAPKDAPPGLERVRELTTRFYSGELDGLYGEFSSEMQEGFTLEQLKALHEDVVTKYGKETELVGEDWKTQPGYRGFVRWARFDKTQEIVQIEWILRDDDDAVAGFFVRTAQPSAARQPQPGN